MKQSGSSKFLRGRGNTYTVQIELGHLPGHKHANDMRRECQLMVLLDTEPVRVKAVPPVTVSWQGEIALSDSASLTVWYEANRVRSIEISDAGRSTLFEGRGSVPDWLSHVIQDTVS